MITLYIYLTFTTKVYYNCAFRSVKFFSHIHISAKAWHLASYVKMITLYIYLTFTTKVYYNCAFRSVKFFSHIHISAKAWHLASYVKCIYKIPAIGTETLYSRR